MPEKTDFSTPLIPQSAAVAVFKACTYIDAPASLVFRTLRNTDTWKDWNRFVPRVNIHFQPDEIDDVTAAEIEELVHNTSIAVTHDSQLVDAGNLPLLNLGGSGPRRGSLPYGGAGQNAMGRPASGGDQEAPKIEWISPPVTRQRLASNASHASDKSRAKSSDERRSPNGLSAAQKFQASTDARRASYAAGESLAPPTEPNAVLLEAPGTNQLMPAPKNTDATTAATQSRRKSGLSEKVRKQLHINALYGEPNVRIQVGTKMTLFCKMNLPSPNVTREIIVRVTEVSRPDESDDIVPFVPSGLSRSQTHTLSKGGVYRLVWNMETGYNPPRTYPKFLLQMQRVHEIRPIIDGAGKETCEYWDWEVWRGMQAKKFNKEHGAYIEKQMNAWGRYLGEFCQTMGGAVERRDFQF